MRLALLAYGTRGDVQPYLALASELAQRGHQVTMTAPVNLAPMVERCGFPCVRIPIDSQAFFLTEEGRRILSSGKTTQFLQELGRREHELTNEIDDALVAACAGADAIITTVLTQFRAGSIAEASGQRLIRALTFPKTPTGGWSSPFLTPRQLPTRFVRRMSHRVFDFVFWRSVRDDVNALRARLKLAPANGAFLRALEYATPTLHMYSERVLPRPREWPSALEVTGYCVLPKALRHALGEDTLPDDLARWLEAGPPPIFFGFGSMPVLDPANTLAMVRELSAQLGRRALVGAGWSSYEVASDVRETDVFVAPSFDHDAVLPRCVAAVHHGGAGTTGAVVAAGIPSVLCYCFADQSLWGWRVEKLGVGSTMPYPRITHDRLFSALSSALREDSRERASALGSVVRSENGGERTASRIEAVLAKQA